MTRVRIIVAFLLAGLLSAGCSKNDGRKLTPTPKTDNVTQKRSRDTSTPVVKPKPDVVAKPPDVLKPKVPTLLEKLRKRLGVPFYPAAKLVLKGTRITDSAANLILATDDPIKRILAFYEGKLKKKATVTELPSGIRYSFPLGSGGRHAILITRTPEVLLSEMGGRVTITIFKR